MFWGRQANMMGLDLARLASHVALRVSKLATTRRCGARLSHIECVDEEMKGYFGSKKCLIQH